MVTSNPISIIVPSATAAAKPLKSQLLNQGHLKTTETGSFGSVGSKLTSNNVDAGLTRNGGVIGSRKVNNKLTIPSQKSLFLKKFGGSESSLQEFHQNNNNLYGCNQLLHSEGQPTLNNLLNNHLFQQGMYLIINSKNFWSDQQYFYQGFYLIR